MGAGEQPFAPGGDKGAVRLKDRHRVLATAEHVDAILWADSDVGHLVKGPALGQLGPIDQLFVDIVPTSEFD